MSINAQIALSIVAHESSSSDLASEMRVTPATYGLMLTNGTGANQSQVVWSDSGTIPDGDEVLHTFASLADDRGTVSMSAVKVIYVKNSGSLPLHLNEYQWAGAPSSSIEIQAGGVIVMAAPTAGGWSTAGAGAGILVVNQNGSSVAYEIMLIGEGTVS